MEIEYEEKGETGVFRLRGRLTAVEAPDLEREVRNRIDGGACLRFLFDLKDLEYISSAGLRILLVGAKLLKGKGGDLLLCSLRDNVGEVFDISGFTSLFKVFPSEEEALAPAGS